MFKVEREGNGFRIKLSGDRHRYIAKNLSEIKQALWHYYGPHRNNKVVSNCPLCRAIETRSNHETTD